jgi:hypothetical protein
MLTVLLVPAHADSSQGHWPFPSDRVGQGYAYILTHPGVPCVFWEHYFEWGQELQKTIDTLLQVGGSTATRRRGEVWCSTEFGQGATGNGRWFVVSCPGVCKELGRACVSRR